MEIEKIWNVLTVGDSLKTQVHDNVEWIPNAVVNLLGPFSISQILINAAEEEMLIDKTYRKLFIQAVCVKAF